MNLFGKKKISSLDSQQKDILEEIKKEWSELLTNAGYHFSDSQTELDIEWLYRETGFPKPKIITVDSFQEIVKISRKYPGITSAYLSNVINPSIDRKLRRKLSYNVSKTMDDCFDNNIISDLKKIEQSFSRKITQEILMPLKSVIPYSAITSNSDFGLSVDFWMISGEFADRIKCINQNDTTEDFHRYCRMVKSGIWYAIFYKETAMICSLPVKIKKDKEGRLHSISEAAVKWKDNQNDYFIHGVNFDRLLWGKITKREIKIKEILQIQNIEQRYAAIQTYGYDTMINEIDAMMIDKSKRGNELYVIRDSLIEGRSLKLLKYSCPSTDRIYHSFVPDDMYNADHAMAWKFNLSLDEYSKLEIET